jgi:hypothetical protein
MFGIVPLYTTRGVTVSKNTCLADSERLIEGKAYKLCNDAGEAHMA